MKATITIDAFDVDDLGPRLALGCENTVKGATQYAEGQAIKLAPKDQGNLQSTITSEFEGGGVSTKGILKAGAKYAEWVHEGTGIFGPRAARIDPKVAKALKIQLPGGTIYRRSIKGMKGRPFFKWAMEAAIPKIQQIASMAFKRALGQ